MAAIGLALAWVRSDAQCPIGFDAFHAYPDDQHRASCPGDFDGDGRVDVARVLVGGSLEIWRAADGGWFDRSAVIPLPFGGAVTRGDFDADGDADLAIFAATQVAVLLGDGGGGFASLPVAAATSMDQRVSGDLDGDGDDDIVGTGGGNVWVVRSNGDGTFALPEAQAAAANLQWPALGDLDGDGRLDVVVPLTTSAVGVLLNDGSGTLLPVAIHAESPGPTSVAVVDVDEDGRADVVAAVDELRPRIFLGNGDGTLAPSFAPPQAATCRTRVIRGADLDGDGHQDLVELCGQRLTPCVRRGHGDGGFEAPTCGAMEQPPSWRVDNTIETGDVDGDGLTDAIFDLDDGFRIGLAAPSGALRMPTTYSLGSAPRALVAVDLTHDGVLDLVASAGGVSVALGAPDGTLQPFVPRIPGTAYALASADFNGDAHPDVVKASTSVAPLFGDGCGGLVSGTSTSVGGLASYVATGDIDGNGTPDVLAHGSVVLVGPGGTFGTAQDLGTLASPSAGVLADLDGDGDLDAVVTDGAAGLAQVFLGNGDGTFGPRSDVYVGTEPHDVLAADVSGDGVPDLITANHGADMVSVLIGTGGGSFGTAVAYPGGHRPDELAAGDLDGDGDLDLLVSTNLVAPSPILAGGATSIRILEGDGAGGFAYLGSLFVPHPSALLLADVDRNGSSDVVVSSYQESELRVAPASGLGTSPADLPDAWESVAYSQQLTATGGSAPYSFSLTGGALPAGLTLAPDGLISGSPSATGPSSFVLRVAGADGCFRIAPRTLLVVGCGSLRVEPPALPWVVVGGAYAQPILAPGATLPVSFRVTAGALPAGLSLDAATGLISGTVAAAGTSAFTVRADDGAGCTGSRSYAVAATCPGISVPGSLPDGTVGAPYAETLSATGGTPPHSFTVTSGSPPPGLLLSIDGTLAGTPTLAGSFAFTVTVADTFACSGTRSFIVGVSCPAVTIAPAALPAAVVAAPYSQTLTASGSVGPYTFSVSNGTVPAGLTLAAGTGVLAGSPSMSGSFSFGVRAWGQDGCVGNKSYGLTVSCPTVTLDPPSIPDGFLGVMYSQTLTASGSAGPYTFSIISGALPPGLALDPSTGALTGTPTLQGSFAFTSMAWGADGCTGDRVYGMSVGCPVVGVGPPALPAATVGLPYLETIAASGMSGPFTFAITSGALPAGLSLESSTGTLSGTPTSPGSSLFTVAATSLGCTGSRGYDVTTSCPTIWLGPPLLPGGTVGAPYWASITAGPGAGPFQYVVSAGSLPTGLTLDAGTGVVSGVPGATGTWSFTVTATMGPCDGHKDYSVTVSCPAITLGPPTLPGGTVGSPYSATVVATGSTGPFVFGVTSGSLPAGLSMDAATGVISGIPSQAGMSSFVVTATTAGCSGSRGFDIAVSCPSITLMPPALPAGAAGVPYAASILASGGTGPYAFAILQGPLPPGLSLSPTGVLSGTPIQDGSFPFSVTATDTVGCTGHHAYVLDVDTAVDHVLGEGLGRTNGNGVRVFRRDGTPAPTSFVAYGAGQWGTNVAAGDIGGGRAEILTGPGPGPVFGPHVRGWLRDGTSMPKVSFFAYGTLRHGANVAAGQVDHDAIEEILTGPGPGQVFGPHVRGFDVGGGTPTPIGKIAFFAYGTLKYGVNVEDGDLDADTHAEIVTGAGPGGAFAATVRAFDHDGAAVTAISKINFNAFASFHGVNVAGGDADGDAFAELVAAPGPGPGNPNEFTGFDYDGSSIAPAPGFAVMPAPATMYGGRVGTGDVSGDRVEELLCGGGRDPAAASVVNVFGYDGASLVLLPPSFLPFTGGAYGFGVNVAAGALGYF